MSDRPYESWTPLQWAVLAVLGGAVLVYLGAAVAGLAGVEGTDRIAAVAAGVLWLAVAGWLVGVQDSIERRWALVGAAGLVVAGVTELAMVAVSAPELETLNLLGLLAGIAVLLADIVGVV